MAGVLSKSSGDNDLNLFSNTVELKRCKFIMNTTVTHRRGIDCDFGKIHVLFFERIL